jgi:uncharacterized protein (TIGR03067 family)
MSRRTLGWSAVAIVAAVLVWSAGDAWGLGFILGESKEQLKLKYDVVVEDPGTGRVTIVLTLADEGRLKPLEEVQLYVPGKEKNRDGTSPPDLVVSIDMVKGEGGTRVGRVQILREVAERAQIWLNTHTMDGNPDLDTRLHHVIPIAKYLKAAPAAGEPAGLLDQTQAADQPKAKEEQPAARKDQKTGEEKPAQPKAQPAKSDQERMVGNWYITNDDSMRKGEMWVIDEGRILMYAKHGGLNANLYLHRLDAGKDPKQIDITVTLVNGPTVGVIKGIYALDGDELRLCLGGLDKDRPAAFPKKPARGEVLILQRGRWGASPPKAAAGEPAAPAPPATERKSD